MDFGAYAMALADDRRAEPRDDLTTASCRRRSTANG